MKKNREKWLQIVWLYCHARAFRADEEHFWCCCCCCCHSPQLLSWNVIQRKSCLLNSKRLCELWHWKNAVEWQNCDQINVWVRTQCESVAGGIMPSERAVCRLGRLVNRNWLKGANTIQTDIQFRSIVCAQEQVQVRWWSIFDFNFGRFCKCKTNFDLAITWADPSPSVNSIRTWIVSFMFCAGLQMRPKRIVADGPRYGTI